MKVDSMKEILLSQGSGSCGVGPWDVETSVGEDVTWTAGDSDATLIFHEASIFQRASAKISANGTLTLTVQQVDQGTYHYDIYCHNTRTLASNGDQPEIIIT